MRYVKNKMNPLSLEELLNFIVEGRDPPTNSITITFDDGYKDFYTSAYPILKKFEIPAAVFLATGFISSSDIEEVKNHLGSGLMLSWLDIESIADDDLIRFGAHTQTHGNLSKLSREIAESEILTSKHKVEEHTLYPCNLFAYPFGYYNDDVKELIRYIGFKCALTTNPGRVSASSDLFELGRIEVVDDSPEFMFILPELPYTFVSLYLIIWKRSGYV
jgi:peptidoglycan/xylan/chitin deacetylase (PgdA/CDA1 family)